MKPEQPKQLICRAEEEQEEQEEQEEEERAEKKEVACGKCVQLCPESMPVASGGKLPSDSQRYEQTELATAENIIIIIIITTKRDSYYFLLEAGTP